MHSYDACTLESTQVQIHGPQTLKTTAKCKNKAFFVNNFNVNNFENIFEIFWIRKIPDQNFEINFPPKIIHLFHQTFFKSALEIPHKPEYGH